MSKDFDKAMQEFLAKGGKIQKVPAVPTPDEAIPVKTSSQVDLLDLGTGQLLYSEFKPKKAKKKKDGPVVIKNVKMDTLPPELVEKLKGKIKF